MSSPRLVRAQSQTRQRPVRVRRRRRDFELRARAQDGVLPHDPIRPRPRLAVGNPPQPVAELTPDRAQHLLRVLKRNAADKMCTERHERGANRAPPSVERRLYAGNLALRAACTALCPVERRVLSGSTRPPGRRADRGAVDRQRGAALDEPAESCAARLRRPLVNGLVRPLALVLSDHRVMTNVRKSLSGVAAIGSPASNPTKPLLKRFLGPYGF